MKKKILISLAVSVGVGVWLVYELSNVSPKLLIITNNPVGTGHALSVNENWNRGYVSCQELTPIHFLTPFSPFSRINWQPDNVMVL